MIPRSAPICHNPYLSDVSKTQLEFPIPSAPITLEWSGIVLAHELSHVLGWFENRRTDRDESLVQWLDNELRAYHVEYLLVDHLSHGRYRHALDEVLTALSVDGLDDLMARVTRHRNGEAWLLLDPLLRQRLDAAVSEMPPASPIEDALRKGFHATALILRSAERENGGIASLGLQPAVVEKLRRAANVILRNGFFDEPVE